jgi:putative nucleotidyltransferase with HDIG domain
MKPDKKHILIKNLQKKLNSPVFIPMAGMFIILIFAFFSADKFFWVKTSYTVGDKAKQTVKASRDLVFEHPHKTEEKKKKAASEILTVYDYDSGMSENIQKKIDLAFESASQTQQNSAETKNSEQQKNKNIKTLFEKHIGFKISHGAFSLLEQNRFSPELKSILKKIVSEIHNNGVVGNKTLLMNEENKGIKLRDIYTGEETTVTNLRKFYGSDQAKTMVRIIGDPLLKNYSYNIVNLAVDFAQRLIKPNITVNINETRERIYQAVESVDPVLYKITKNEIIVRKGEPITPLQLVKLNALKKHNSFKEHWTKITGKSISILFFISVVYMTFLRGYIESSKNPNKNILFLSLIIVFNIILAKLFSLIPASAIGIGNNTIPAIAVKLCLPVASAAMVVCLFFGQYQAYSVAVICSFICAMVLGDYAPGLFIFYLINGVMGTFWLKECRERQDFVKTGGKLALLNILAAPAFLIQIPGISGFEIAAGIFFAMSGGILSGILTGGISPLLEILFGYSSDIKYMELSNPEQKLLRRLMLEAPGTYNHSMIVGTMAEAAAAETGANSVFARVGGYYHDIGKLKKPLYFIENQRHSKNLHDKLSPSMSTLILTAHVKDGIILGKKHKLPEGITDIIAQHHGTSLIKYFYEKAKQKDNNNEPVKDHFRYPGPRPQSREAAIVMLADISEAAVRSLDNPSVSRIQGTVHKQINACFSDGQLDECTLTLKDLHKIAKSFNKILSGIHHHRIKYTEEQKENAQKDGNSDSKQEKSDKNTKQNHAEESISYLRRLGL